MIYVYTGTPGSGKTLAGVKKCKQFRGKRLYTNIDCKVPHRELHVVPKDYMLDTMCQNYRVEEKQHLIIIDEAQMWFNCRDWNAKDRREWLEFFTHHRKYGYDIILITQSFMFLDKQIREVAEYEYSYRKVSRWGIFGFFVCMLTFGEKYVYIEKYIPANQKVGMHLSFLNRKLFKLYNTFAHPGLAFDEVEGQARMLRLRLENLPTLDYNLISRTILSTSGGLYAYKGLRRWGLFMGRVLRLAKSGIDVQTRREQQEERFYRALSKAENWESDTLRQLESFTPNVGADMLGKLHGDGFFYNVDIQRGSDGKKVLASG